MTRHPFRLAALGLAAACLLLSALPGAAQPAGDGFVQLFNGRDLTGWKTHPDDKAKWEVKDGAITASGPVNEPGICFSFRYG